jgi:hypothetical protein
VQQSARTGAIRQWNARACGALEGDKDSLEYLRRVEADRYSQQPWQHGYFRFVDFRGKFDSRLGWYVACKAEK